MEWKSTLLGLILGITLFWSGNPLSKQWNPLQSSGLNHSFESGFPLQMKWSLIWLLKEWISTPAHLESGVRWSIAFPSASFSVASHIASSKISIWRRIRFQTLHGMMVLTNCKQPLHYRVKCSGIEAFTFSCISFQMPLTVHVWLDVKGVQVIVTYMYEFMNILHVCPI